MGKLYCVNICGIRGVVKSIDLCNTEEQFKSMTVKQLKDRIRQTFPATPEDLRLIFTDKMLDEDFKPLCEYGIQHMSFIQVVLRLPGGRCLPTAQCSWFGDRIGKIQSTFNYHFQWCKEHSKPERQLNETGKIYKVKIAGIRGVVKLIDLCNTEEQFRSMTVKRLKDKIRQIFPSMSGDLRLIFTDKMLNGDFNLLCEYGIQHMSVIQVVLRLPAGRCLPTGECSGFGTGLYDYHQQKQNKCIRSRTKQNKMGKICQVKVFGPDGDLKVIELSSTEEQFQSMTVELLRDKIRQAFPNIPANQDLRLIFTDKLLCVESNLLCDYGIQHMSIIQVEPRVPGGGNLPTGENSGMGDKNGRNRSMERLCGI